MSKQVNELLERGKALEPDEREQLVDLLIQSLEGPSAAKIDASWSEEIERRLAEYASGQVQAIDAEEVFAKARRLAR